MMSAFIVTSFVALQLGTLTVKLSSFTSTPKPREIRVFTIVSFEISIPVYLSTKALSNDSETSSYFLAYSSVSEETTFAPLSISVKKEP